jgi:hypothetical protein
VFQVRSQRRGAGLGEIEIVDTGWTLTTWAGGISPALFVSQSRPARWVRFRRCVQRSLVLSCPARLSCTYVV